MNKICVIFGKDSKKKKKNVEYRLVDCELLKLKNLRPYHYEEVNFMQKINQYQEIVGKNYIGKN